MPDQSSDRAPERFPWAGPALFTAVAVALFVFFWWFVQA